MDFTSVKDQLMKLTDREEHYKKDNSLSKEFYESLDTKEIDGKTVYLFNNFIPFGQDFNIVKHTRFVRVPTHVHSFIELNYIYSGTCTQIIDGKKVELVEGDICLIDTSVPHSIENTTEKDIIINILVKKEYFLKQIGQEGYTSSIVFDFMLNALSERQSHKQYIVFKNGDTDQTELVMNQILYEYFENQVGSKKIIENLISILFTLLVRDLDYDTNKNDIRGKAQIVDILQYIDKNFLNVDLDTLARKFNYTTSYISYLLKEETGRTFTQLVIGKKLDLAETLLLNSTYSIQECAEESGFSNLTFFYKKYKARFNKLPSETIGERKRID